MSKFGVAVLTACLLTVGTAPVLAQVTTKVNAASGKSVRLVIAPNLKRDCSVGPLPEIRIIGAPKNGSLITRAGKVKTPASYRCPSKDAEVQAVFYQSRNGYTGSDEATFEIRTADGSTEKRTVQITVGSASGTSKETTDL